MMSKILKFALAVAASYVVSASSAWAGQCPSADPNCTCVDDGNVCTDTVKKTVIVANKPRTVCTYPDRDGAQCRGSGGPCDVREYCQGSVCPADSIRPAGYVCRPVEGPCDVQDECNGGSKSCPQAFRDEGTACDGDGDGACDLPDSCTGSSAACPSTVVAAGTVCRDPDGLCNPAELCNGDDPSCPDDGYLDDGYLCDDGDACTDDDICLGGLCTGAPVEMCMAGDAGVEDAGPGDAGVGDAGTGDELDASGDAGLGRADEGGCQLAGSSGGRGALLALVALALIRRRRGGASTRLIA